MSALPTPRLALISLACLLLQSPFAAARYAAIVIDADSGRVIHENESTQRWYPASLTKVMTMYMTFAALESGDLKLTDTVYASKHAASMPSSKLGLRAGQSLTVEQAIMAVTTRSANDAAVVLAERLGGTESNFAAMMTQTAHRLGMSSSSFENASGLPNDGQISSARDLALLSAAVLRDFPQYYHYFSATEFRYKGRVMPNTNKILKTYPDADGFKTGFTCGSGYNLIASAKRNGHRIIGVLLGAHSSGERFEQMSNLLDMGFAKSGSSQLGEHISQLHDTAQLPPPFQLASNRCAGSAEQMGADSGSISRYEPIRINETPESKERRLLAANKPQPRITGQSWNVSLGSFPRKIDADVNLQRVRNALGPLAKNGQPRIVKSKNKRGTVWLSQWTGLQQDDSRDFCRRLHGKNLDCSSFPQPKQTVAAAGNHGKTGHRNRSKS
ncbi:D-alanyl-D-alanine carboxypeptidase family protein [Methylomonas koyamae]|uniref:D-alanyl-D-alanine carboxypeptidase family protein n=1 Tax=Methylomonas koyamae TaxID=702114 RepID=UPI000AA0E59F|nr:D-alanyl-D-alanine carboxypeptidase family protein [Methylomonas koyamae]WNB75296.1 D-alanyl-D-alanine carboxypeptidase family protein [Methylomonas koyamae]BBL60070.1 D-alanyl-D-alanine carboxypeptidase [Methylomonas koyamae]